MYDLTLINTILSSYLSENIESDDTDAVRSFFRRLGAERKRVVYPNESVGEWLYDLCWSVEDVDWEFKNEHYMELVLESEWDPSWVKIAEDFYKLLDSKAPIKVGICKSNNGANTINRIIQMIKTWKYKSKDERYLIFIHGYGKESGTNGYILNSDGIIAKHHSSASS